jgi:pyridoxamine 5'-phosphate oxidase
VEYEARGLDLDDLDPDPVAQWQRWYAEAESAGVAVPTAMVVATMGLDGTPDARAVLAERVDERGITFFTNYTSPKSQQLDASAGIAAVFPWYAVHRQVRVRGRAERLTADESDVYFASRPRGSQIGAWASPQSEEIADRATLDAQVAEMEARFEGAPVPRPPFWGGWRLVPVTWELWQERPDRLHDRFRYTRNDTAATWHLTRLAP